MHCQRVIAALLLIAVVPLPVAAQEGPQDERPVNTRIDPEAERIWVDARVNNATVRLVLDTGAARSVLFRDTAKRLGLKVFETTPDSAVEPGKVTIHRTEACSVTLGLVKYDRIAWGVIDIPPPLQTALHGVLGWDFIRQGILEIDWDRGLVGFRPEVPSRAAGWTKWKVREDAEALIVELAGEDTETVAVLLDTGAPNGVSFGAELWREWNARHEKASSTLHGVYSPGYGLHVEPVQWAKKLRLGALEIEGMPVGFTGHPMLASWRCGAAVGLYGMSRFNLVIDGPGRTVHVSPRPKFAWKSGYNRLGAVFIPEDLRSSALNAHVAPGSPAERAGIRAGDRLLKIGDLDVTVWQTDPQVLPLSRFWWRPAGTELVLTIARGPEQRLVTVKLEDIFPDARRFDP
jgi:hypothetical protein